MSERWSSKKMATVWTAVGVVVIVLLIGMLFGIKGFGRYQKLADARNKVKVSTIEIRNQEQRVLIAKQEAEIRHEQSKGVKQAQDEIAKTLTPLYVQFEMVEALKEIARSGSNSSVVFIPSGEAGIPIIQDALSKAQKNE